MRASNKKKSNNYLTAPISNSIIYPLFSLVDEFLIYSKKKEKTNKNKKEQAFSFYIFGPKIRLFVLNIVYSKKKIK